MNAPVKVHPHGLWSLWDMLELNANNFLAATTQLARMHALTADSKNGPERLNQQSIDFVAPHLEDFTVEADKVGARLAGIAATRLLSRVRAVPCLVTVSEFAKAISEIESRFADHLLSVKLFVLTELESVALQPGHQLLGPVIAERFPSMIFEIEEAAKCLALSRATASAFHSMRAVEVMLVALRRFLEIPESDKPAERSWAIVLKAIKDAMDARYPARARKTGSEGARVEAIYASLDAIKNPWRNTTMHVEQVYQPFEASHILQCVNVLAMRMAELCDQDGNRPSDPEGDATAFLAALEGP